MRFTQVLVLVSSALLLTTAAACGDGKDAAQAGGEDTLKVGADPAYIPFSFSDPKTNEMTGFDHDFAQALAKQVGSRMDYQGVAWDGIIPALNSGKIDVITSISITKDRAKEVDFTKPHMKQTIAAVVRPDYAKPVNNIKDLSGKKVGVMGGTAASTFLAGKKNLDVTTYNSPSEEYNDLRLKRIDVVVIESPQAGYAAENEYEGKIKVASSNLGGPTVLIAAAVKKGNTQLVNKLNKGIDKIQSDGTYESVIHDWFGDIDYQVPDQ